MSSTATSHDSHAIPSTIRTVSSHNAHPALKTSTFRFSAIVHISSFRKEPGGDRPGERAGSDSFFLSPGVRFAIDLPSGLQIVPGIAVPLGVGPSDGERGVFLYLSLEHAYRRGR